jgi:hypothetical protein
VGHPARAAGSEKRLWKRQKRLTTHFILSKQGAQGRWKLENSLQGKMWADIEQKGKPSKWVTLRALRVLKNVYGNDKNA